MLSYVRVHLRHGDSRVVAMSAFERLHERMSGHVSCQTALVRRHIITLLTLVHLIRSFPLCIMDLAVSLHTVLALADITTFLACVLQFSILLLRRWRDLGHANPFIDLFPFLCFQAYVVGECFGTTGFKAT